MADIALPRHQCLMGPAFQAQRDNQPGTASGFSTRQGLGLRSDTFVFHPSLPSDDQDRSTSPTKASSAACPTGSPAQQRGHNRTRNSVHALPSFNFNAANVTGLSNGPTSPPLEPEAETPTTPTRASRHRRIASEHISATVTGPVRLRSRSPLKNEVNILSSDLSPPSGHRHRRSGAISSQDLKTVVRPSTPSSPTTALRNAPTSDSVIPFPPPSPNRTRSLPLPITRTTSNETCNSDHDSVMDISRPRPVSQARVGFSDTVEFIPRPLSTISSETESSLSTLRGHSVAGSISSVLSYGTTSPSVRMSPAAALPPTILIEVPPPRPKSAGLIMDRSRRGLINITHDLTHLRRPLSASGPSRSPKASVVNLHDSDLAYPDATGSPARRDLLKVRGMRTWANSLVMRRPKSPGDYDATPPPSTNVSSEGPKALEVSPKSPPVQFSENFDEDPTATILHDVPAFLSLHPASSNDPTLSTYGLGESSGPMIDLDMAQVRTDSSSSVTQTYGLKTRSFSTARYSMHSSGSMGGFTGPGMHYHRRAESAPQLAAMVLDRPILTRLGSSSSTEAVHEMEDVFEEEEEDSETPKTKITKWNPVKAAEKSAENNYAGAEIYENNSSPKRPQNLPRPVSSRINRPIRPTSNWSSKSYDSPRSSIVTGQDAIAIHDVQKLSHAAYSASYETPAASPTVDGSKSMAVGNSMPFIYMPQSSNPTTPTDISFLSPHSPYNLPYSLSTPALETTGTSIADSRKYSLYGPGESCSEFRPSVDDVPSLISSRSGFTSANHTHIPSVSSRNQEDGAASFVSFSSATPQSDPRWKRASIASLSRLVGFGEKSKLSTEYSVPGTRAPAAKSKEKRSRRLGRLLQFWRSKELQAAP